MPLRTLTPSSYKFQEINERGLKGEHGLTRSQTGSNPAPAPPRFGYMKTLIAFLISTAAVYGFIGLAEAGIFTDIIAHLKPHTSIGAGKIPWPAFMLLLATGIIGILGIRRRGKKP